MSRGSVMDIRVVARSSRPIRKFDGVEWRQSSDSGSSCRIKAYCTWIVTQWLWVQWLIFLICTLFVSRGQNSSFSLLHTLHRYRDHTIVGEGSVRKKDIFLAGVMFLKPDAKMFEKFMDRYNSPPPKIWGGSVDCT